MNLEFEIHGSLVRARADRSCTEEELLEGMERASRHPDFRPLATVLVDCRAILEIPESRDLASTGQLLSREGARLFSRVALIATGPMQFGLTRMFAMHADTGKLEVQAFEDEQTALSWLAAAPQSPRRG
jgi:hypothetical protein